MHRWWLNAWPHRWQVRRHVPKFLVACPEPFRGQVLEVGAGGGWTSRRMLETFPQIELTATDVDANATRKFEQLQERYGRRLRVREADARQLSFDRESFDVVVAINMMRYLEKEDVPKVLRELIRVVRVGGLVGVSNLDRFGLNRGLCQVIAEVLKEECDILKSSEGKYCDYWARKPYSLKGGGQ